MEEGSDPRAICNRRDYARWIIASSSTLTRYAGLHRKICVHVSDSDEARFSKIAAFDAISLMRNLNIVVYRNQLTPFQTNLRFWSAFTFLLELQFKFL